MEFQVKSDSDSTSTYIVNDSGNTTTNNTTSDVTFYTGSTALWYYSWPDDWPITINPSTYQHPDNTIINWDNIIITSKEVNNMKTNVYDNGDSFIAELAMPGVKKEWLSVGLKNAETKNKKDEVDETYVLVIELKRNKKYWDKLKEEQSKLNFLKKEFVVNDETWTYDFGKNVDATKPIEAELKDGVLTIVVPKKKATNKIKPITLK